MMEARVLSRKDIRSSHRICIFGKSVYTKSCFSTQFMRSEYSTGVIGGLRGPRLPYDSGDFNDFSSGVYT